MLFILFAALFSVSVSVLLKLFKLKQLDIFQILAFGYLSASGLSLWFFKPHFSSLDLTKHGWLICIMGLLLPTVFWCLDRSLLYAGLFKTEIAQRISVVLTLSISALLYQEQFSALKLAGLLLGLAAVLLMLLSKSSEHTQTKQASISLLCVWVGYAATDLLFKYTASPGMQFAAVLSAIFITATVLMFGWNGLRRVQWQLPSMTAGLLLGTFNFANIALYLRAHQTLSQQPSVVFASMNICVVVFGMLAALLIFKEKATTSKVCGGLCAIVAVLLLMLSMN